MLGFFGGLALNPQLTVRMISTLNWRVILLSLNWQVGLTLNWTCPNPNSRDHSTVSEVSSARIFPALYTLHGICRNVKTTLADVANCQLLTSWDWRNGVEIQCQVESSRWETTSLRIRNTNFCTGRGSGGQSRDGSATHQIGWLRTFQQRQQRCTTSSIGMWIRQLVIIFVRLTVWLSFSCFLNPMNDYLPHISTVSC